MARTVFDLLHGPPKMLDIAVYLLDKDEVRVGEVMSHFDLSTESFYSSVDKLESLGFLFVRKERGFPPPRFIGLTVKGEEVARLLKPLDELVRSSVEALKRDLEELEGKERSEEENQRMVKILRDMQEIAFVLGNWDEAERYARRTLDIASAMGDNESLSVSFRTLGKIHYEKGRLDDAESDFSESLKVASRANDREGMAQSYYFLGGVLVDRGKHDEAMEALRKASEAAESSEDKVLKARAEVGLARMLGKKGKYDESLRKVKESIRTFEELEEYDELPRAYAYAGAAAFSIDLDESFEWHEKSVEMATKNSDLRILGYGLSNMAGVYNKKGEPKKALPCLDRAVEISETLEDKPMTCSVNIQKGWAHRLLDQLKKSDKCFERAVRLAEDNGLTFELGDALLNWAYVDIARDEKVDARKKLKRAIKLFEELGNQSRANMAKKVLRKLSR